MTKWTQSLAKADFGVDVQVFSESDSEIMIQKERLDMQDHSNRLF